MATNTRKKVVPAGGETPKREAINKLADSILDPVPVANWTEVDQLVADLTAEGDPPSPTRPLFVYNAELPAGARLIYSDDGGTSWSLADDIVTYTTGTTTWKTEGLPLGVSRRGGTVVLSGRVSRSGGTGVVVGTIPVGFRPPFEVPGFVQSKNSGNADGPRFEVIIGVTGSITVTLLSGGPAWGTGTWLSFNMTWPL